MASPARSAACSRGCSGFGGEPILDGGNIIGLKQGDAAISLEPAGQLELSGAPVETLHDTKAELEAHYDQVRAVSRDLQTRLRAAGLPSGRDARADAVDAEGPLRDHAALHADWSARSAST